MFTLCRNCNHKKDKQDNLQKSIYLSISISRGVQHLHSTQDDQEDVVAQRQQHAGVAHVTLEDDGLPSLWQREAPRSGHLQQQPDRHHDQLDGDETQTDEHLRGRADETRPGRARPVFDAAEDAGDPVGLSEEGRVADGERRA